MLWLLVIMALPAVELPSKNMLPLFVMVALPAVVPLLKVIEPNVPLTTVALPAVLVSLKFRLSVLW